MVSLHFTACHQNKQEALAHYYKELPNNLNTFMEKQVTSSLTGNLVIMIINTLGIHLFVVQLQSKILMQWTLPSSTN